MIIPDDAVDQRKLGSELLILNSSFRPHSNFYIVIKMPLKDNIQRLIKVIASKAYVAITRGHKIMSSTSRTRGIFLVDTFS